MYFRFVVIYRLDCFYKWNFNNDNNNNNKIIIRKFCKRISNDWWWFVWWVGVCVCMCHTCVTYNEIIYGPNLLFSFSLYVYIINNFETINMMIQCKSFIWFNFIFVSLSFTFIFFVCCCCSIYNFPEKKETNIYSIRYYFHHHSFHRAPFFVGVSIIDGHFFSFLFQTLIMIKVNGTCSSTTTTMKKKKKKNTQPFFATKFWFQMFD